MNPKITYCFLLVLLIACRFSAQEWQVDLSYKYLYSKQWDKAIQTYNFSRPFLSEKQSLLRNGLTTSLSYSFKNEKQLKQGINISYCYSRSSAENKNFNNAFNLHFITMGYLLHFENWEKWKGLYTDFIISATSSALFRNLNGESFEYDETKSKAFGIGGDINFKFGYAIKLNNRSFLSPFVAMGYTPYLYSPNSEAVINQTKGLTSMNWTSIWSTQIGVKAYLREEKNQ